MNLSEKIRKNISVPFGICSFSCVEDKLLSCRAKIRLPLGALSVICFAFPYKVKDLSPRNISRYAAVPDYHKVCGEMLGEIREMLKAEYPEYEFEPFVDNSPIPEVFAAASAGLGVIGENGLLITPRYGSFVFLGEIVTDMYLSPEDKTQEACIKCGRCKTACPVELCKENCVSAVTQQKKPLSQTQKQQILKVGSVWGCDICQNVCPLNKNAQLTKIAQFCNGYRDFYVSGEDISGRAYEWRGDAPVRRNAELSENPAEVIATDAATFDSKNNI